MFAIYVVEGWRIVVTMESVPSTLSCHGRAPVSMHDTANVIDVAVSVALMLM